jgi:hypothetical protein
MPSAQPVGPPVDDSEDVYRAILYPAHWNGSENRPSSAAFDDAVFSVDIASRTTVEQTRSRFRIVLQLVQFNKTRCSRRIRHTHTSTSPTMTTFRKASAKPRHDGWRKCVPP